MWGRRLFSTAVILTLSAGVAYAARGPRLSLDRRTYLERTEKELDSFEERFDVLKTNTEAQMNAASPPSETFMEMDDLELLAKDIRGDLLTLASAPERGWRRRKAEIDRKLTQLKQTLASIAGAAQSKFADAK